jgi:rRNA maturation endonuclease Nob1
MPEIVCPDCKKISLYEPMYETKECCDCGRKFTLREKLHAIMREGLAEAKEIAKGRPKEPDK